MDDNSNNKTTYEVVNFSTKEKNKRKYQLFKKYFYYHFFSGILGTSLVIGTCFGVPQIREKKIIGNSSTLVNTSTLSVLTAIQHLAH